MLSIKSVFRLHPFLPTCRLNSFGDPLLPRLNFNAAINPPKRTENTSTFPQALSYQSQHIILMIYIILSVFVFIMQLSTLQQCHSTVYVRDQRTVLCTHWYSNLDPPDVWLRVFTITQQRRTCLTHHSSFHYLLLCNKSIDIHV